MWQTKSTKDRIKCSMCNKQLLFSNFSQTQINRAKTRTSWGIANCNGCLLGTRNQEIKCAGCSKWKSIDDFTKTQRRDRDNANCKDCALEREYQLVPHEYVKEAREKTEEDQDYDLIEEEEGSVMSTNVYDDSISVCF
jgi:hypothetical protein